MCAAGTCADGRGLFLITLAIGVVGTLIAYALAGKSMHEWFDYSVAGWAFEAFMPGIGEEFLFRGLVQRGLNQSIRWSFMVLGVEVKSGTLMTSLLFGLVAFRKSRHAAVGVHDSTGDLRAADWSRNWHRLRPYAEHLGRGPRAQC